MVVWSVGMLFLSKVLVHVLSSSLDYIVSMQKPEPVAALKFVLLSLAVFSCQTSIQRLSQSSISNRVLVLCFDEL